MVVLVVQVQQRFEGENEEKDKDDGDQAVVIDDYVAWANDDGGLLALPNMAQPNLSRRVRGLRALARKPRWNK